MNRAELAIPLNGGCAPKTTLLSGRSFSTLRGIASAFAEGSEFYVAAREDGDLAYLDSFDEAKIYVTESYDRCLRCSVYFGATEIGWVDEVNGEGFTRFVGKESQ